MADIKAKWPFPTNAALLGTHAEEVKALRGRIEKNLDASPMPAAAPAKLLNPAKNSEHLRVGDPQVVTQQVEGLPVTLTHVVFRRVLTKMRRRGAVLFDEAVDTEPLGDEVPSSRREQMKRMLERERAMLEILDRYNGLAESVYMRLLASSKG